MIQKEIVQWLQAHGETGYAVLIRRLTPVLAERTVYGVRTPALRSYALQISGREDIQLFLKALPHDSFDENQLHAMILNRERDLARLIPELQEFLPYVDNWATCDQLVPPVLKKDDQLLSRVQEWINSEAEYTVRFGVGMLMRHYLDMSFEPRYLEMARSALNNPVCGDTYYVRMMVAWYFATALAKQPEAALPYFEQKRLERWTHNKAISKAVESRRISPTLAQHLKALRIPKEKT